MDPGRRPGAAPAIGGREWAMLFALAALSGGSFFFNAVAVRERPSFTLVWLRVAAAALLLLPLLLPADRPWTLAMPHPETWAGVAGVALLSTALAYVLYFRILAAAGATNLLLVTFLIPVSAILLGAAVLGETLVLRHLRGMALIGGGLACIDGRAFRPRRHAALAGFDP